MTQQRPPRLAVPCSKCGWFHRRSAEQIRAEREATVAANQAEHKRKHTYAVRREHVGYRFSMFKAQAARRGKEVELRQLDFAKLLRRPCLYCGATQRIGIDRVQNNGHYTRENSVPCCASCNYMKGTLRLRDFAERARCISTRLGALARTQSA